MKNSWGELLEFETRDLVEQYFKRIHDSDVNSWKIHEVTSNFIQGREYFTSAKTAGFTVKPLLLYYGVLALSRALILTLTPKVTENTLKPSHGIDIRNWTEVLKNKDFENLELVIGDGSFSEVLNATENKNYLRSGTDVINYHTHLNTPLKGQKITLQQIYQYIPDLNNEFKKWTGNNIPFAIIDELIHEDVDGKIRIKLYSYDLNDELIETLLPTQYCKNREAIYSKNSITIRYENSGWGPNITQKFNGPFNLGQTCIVPPLANDVGFNLVSSMLAISYTFGMMARYFPSTWISLRRVEKGDKIYPLIHTTLNYIEEKFPIVVLDFLKGPYKFE